MSYYQQIFNPESIAIIGASSREGSVGNSVLSNLMFQGFKGKLYPINPKNEEILGIPCFASYEVLPQIPDLAIIIVPAKMVPEKLTEIAQKGTKAVIIISAGFKEIGGEGLELEKQVKQICEANDITLIGVNCLGVMNVKTKMNASFAASLPDAGNIALVAQSGALCTSVIDYSHQLGLGFSKIISIGNKTSFNEMEILEYLENDPDTKVVMLYLEDINFPQDILLKSKKLNKPVVILKSGRTEEGRAAAASHTGALGGSDAIYDALFRQSSFIRADTIEELFSFSLTFATNPLPKGPNVAIITNAGGPGGITIDAVSKAGLKVASLSPETTQFLAENLPTAASVKNPVDVLGDAKADRYQLAINKVLADENVDSLIVILTPQSMTDVIGTAWSIIQAKEKYAKPIIASFMGMDKVSLGNQILASKEVTTIAYPDHGAKVLGLLWESVKNKNYHINSHAKPIDISVEKKIRVQKILDQFAAGQNKYITEDQSKAVLENYKLPVLKSFVVTSAQEALEKAPLLESQYIVCKIVSQDVVHKSDVGGVILEVLPGEADKAYNQIIENITKNVPSAKIEGVLMVPMIFREHGYELILGVKDEPGIGKSVMFGMGGTMVEVFKDITFSIAPIDLAEAERMIHRIKSEIIFEGVRGKPEMDTEALVQTILQLSELVTDFPEISELDINPLVILPKGQGCKVLDSRIILK
jgi:acetyltransferase